MKAVILIIVFLLLSGAFIDLLLSWNERRTERRRRQMLEMENTEFDLGHNIRHTSDEDI